MTDDRSMLERAARAMFDRVHARPDGDGEPWERAKDWLKAEYLADVVVALRALREPDEAMLKAMSRAVWRTAIDADDLGSEDVLRGWQSAIDSILAEQPATGETR